MEAAAAAAGGSRGFAPTCSCANSSAACQTSVRDAAWNVPGGREREEDEEKKCQEPAAQMWTRTAGDSDGVRDAQKGKGRPRRVKTITGRVLLDSTKYCKRFTGILSG